ncbi:flagellar hook-length control protein FliK [Paralcaligenes ginsengisoli]
MSIGGPSALGTLLVQRLDAVLGTTLSQQANIVSGARPDAVTQPDNPSWLGAAENEMLRHPREAVDQAKGQAGQQSPLDKSRLGANRPDSNLAYSSTATDSTPSAPTTLGYAARTILALLNTFPEQAPAMMGKAPLANPEPTAANSQTAGAPPPGTRADTASASPANAASTAPAAAATAGAGMTRGAGEAGNAGIPARVFVQALSQALQSSGLFYESHLSDLSFGQRSVDSLLPEPQAQLARAAPGHAQPDTSAYQPSTAGATARDADASLAGAPAARSDPSAAGAQAQTTSSAASSAQTAQLAGLHPDTHLLVRQQLEVLANQAFIWRGEAWPNTPMQWEIRRQADSPDTPEADNHWATRLNLTLPRLGNVEARLSLAGQQLVMHLVAPESADQLSEQSAELRSRLLGGGLQLSRLSIAQTESASAASEEIIP